MIITLKEYENGGRIDVYETVNQTTGDFKKIFACCDYFAKKGSITLITPHFNATTVNKEYEAIYASLKGTAYWGKCPDFCVDGIWYEHEGYDETKDLNDSKKRVTTFCNMVKRGLRQSDKIILEDCGVSLRYVRRNIFNRVYCENQIISEVYFRTSEGLVLLYKNGNG